MKLIVGLGNPGDRYNNNRSNIGFKILDVIANNIGIEIKTKKKKSLIGRGDFEGDEVVLLKPQTFSELSGESVLYIASFLKIQVKDIVVIHEDLELELGQIVVTKGGENDSNPGVNSISVSLRSPNFIRIRIGVLNSSFNPKKREDFLREDFEPLENLSLIQIINDAEAAIRSISMGDIDEVIQKYHL
ncbi:aminoacyl-tRNA hydrolase [Leptospira biflexa]|jgi:PTH1 family peptidyl-tRNA hydrolase|uniref:Peptidyl-tRNA hydrolase (PTH) n=1 Tax=Leptospira biflexa serovar Patoc (strain Patoc 1 / ATCC 23582 / Paris) TaxID=456481 RepID=B0SKG1_LEPBP|nr:aminoacyl-tRNA hydrolase [Leptospira biflexa]ABZ92773.1 Aminoacyl-tRNA hydrolase [Leptospira biflexa serovar Patoc strain 'Patoc 1 (Ames)']ABZ96379.1 Peptidyl-tRNA hydrolase (PTH) [Leptospira biflexa serovar Patoc strain 'Patoc 1 (Paris)']TGM37710.1 aminoacyl-tRNA hydrolase [Leptospira biflexa]TGM41046.1 aminoacyl-tRNA hydrolase [Leptospira biflexa]TGM47249.1 aminoacyl-tRNA hydrolase [Leptospira biflexa]